MSTARTTATVGGMEYLVDKIMHVFDPVLDPILAWLRNLMVWIRNRFSGHKLPKPVVMTEAEYEASFEEEEDPVLLIVENA